MVTLSQHPAIRRYGNAVYTTAHVANITCAHVHAAFIVSAVLLASARTSFALHIACCLDYTLRRQHHELIFVSQIFQLILPIQNRAHVVESVFKNWMLLFSMVKII